MFKLNFIHSLPRHLAVELKTIVVDDIDLFELILIVPSYNDRWRVHEFCN